MQAQRAVVHLKDQVNKLEAELEDQRTHKQMAMVENEQLRMEVEALRAQTAIAASMQASIDDGESSFLYRRPSMENSFMHTNQRPLFYLSFEFYTKFMLTSIFFQKLIRISSY